MKRIFLFLATSLAIVFVLSITMRLLGVEPYLNANGLNLTSLLIFAAVMGFGGSFISLAISKWSAKTAMGVHVIEVPSNSTEIWLVETVRKYSQQAGIQMPEVGRVRPCRPPEHDRRAAQQPINTSDPNCWQTHETPS